MAKIRIEIFDKLNINNTNLNTDVLDLLKKDNNTVLIIDDDKNLASFGCKIYLIFLLFLKIKFLMILLKTRVSSDKRKVINFKIFIFCKSLKESKIGLIRRKRKVTKFQI